MRIQVARCLTPSWVALFTALTLPCLAADPPTAGTILRIVARDDWSLPAGVKPTPNTGWAEVDPKVIADWESRYPTADTNPNTLYYHRAIGFNWAEMNPGPGVFEWTAIDRAVEEISRTPHMGFSLLPGIWSRKSTGTGTRQYPFGGDRPITYRDSWSPTPRERRFPYPMIPTWLPVPYLSTGLAAGWDPSPANEYLSRLREFVNALAARYRKHPRFAWVHAGCMDFAWGEGQFRPPWNADAAAQRAYYEEAVRAGLTSETYSRFLRSLVDIFRDAFRGQEGRVVWTNHEDDDTLLAQFGGPGYRAAKEQSWRYAVERGLGGRDGQVEVWMRYLTAGYGNTVARDGYLVMNEDYPPIRDGRVWYTENENWTGHFVPSPEMLPDIHRTRGLRLLQMRRNWDWGDLRTSLQFPEFGRYIQLSLGKTRANSPDAWVWLRQAQCRLVGPGEKKEVKPVKNFERWLFQRDVAPDGQTVPAAPFDISAMHQHASVGGEEYIARRTDHARGQDSGGRPQNVQIFVTFQDAGEAQWLLEYDTAEGRRRSPIVSSAGSGTWKTALLHLPGLLCRGGFTQSMDFRLLRLAGGDPLIRMMRVVKTP